MTRPLPKPSKKHGGITLTKQLRILAAQIDVLSQDGLTLISKAEKLAEICWQRALGYEERTADGKLIPHNPETWAIQLLFDRLEGRVPVAVDDGSGKTLAEKVTELGKAKINALAAEAPDAADPGGDTGDFGDSPGDNHVENGAEDDQS